MLESLYYHKTSKYLDTLAWQTVQLKEKSDQGLHCLSFHLHLLDKFQTPMQTFKKGGGGGGANFN